MLALWLPLVLLVLFVLLDCDRGEPPPLYKRPRLMLSLLIALRPERSIFLPQGQLKHE